MDVLGVNVEGRGTGRGEERGKSGELVSSSRPRFIANDYLPGMHLNADYTDPCRIQRTQRIRERFCVTDGHLEEPGVGQIYGNR